MSIARVAAPWAFVRWWRCRFVAEDKVAGLLEVFSSQPYAFKANDISVLQQLTGNITSALGHGTPIPGPRRLKSRKRRR